MISGPENTRRYLLVGLPETGKTTFLAALWHTVESGEVPGSLCLHRLHGDREYLNKIRNDWLACRKLDRTFVQSEKLVSMQLREAEGTQITEVTIPDLSGETFRLQWETRQWSGAYKALAEAAHGGLLFVHPDHVVEPVAISEANEMMRALTGPQEPGQIVTHETELTWDPSLAPTHVQLVELLQFIRPVFVRLHHFRVAVIVSAWDLVRNGGESPDQWLAHRLPLLYQYLQANSEDLPSRVYGVSAQGGELQSDAASLLEHLRPTDRICITGVDCTAHDITAPMKWLTTP